MTLTIARRRLLALIIAVFAVIGFVAVQGLAAAPAKAGTIGCGNDQFGFYNRTNPSAQVWIYHPALCGSTLYNNGILTIGGDTVFLDWTGGGYMVLSPRNACDIQTDRMPTGYNTVRNYSYSTTEYIWVEDYGSSYYRVTLCNAF